MNLDSETQSIIDKINSRIRISTVDAVVLWNKASLSLLGKLACEIKREKSGNYVFYNKNIHIEPTNICVFNCSFCSYRRPAGSSEAWDYSMEDVENIARSYAGKNITEVHIVGGVHPKHDLYYYAYMIRSIKTILPNVVVKAFTAIELGYMVEKSGLSIKEGLLLLKNAGMEAIPGGGAEIFDEGIRARICPEKGSSKQWIDIHRQAHGLGISTNATILYGHIEGLEHRMDHLSRLRDLQDQTGGFNAFIPLKYRNRNNSMSAIGEVNITEDMRMLAISRIFLDNFPHIKAYWPMFGKTTTELALLYGADDIDGTIDDSTKIYSMAGAEDKNPVINIEEINSMALSAGFVAVERDTFYKPVNR